MQGTAFSLVTYQLDSRIHVGLAKDGRVWEINRALASRALSSGEEAPVHTMLDLLNRWDALAPLLREAAGLLDKVSVEESVDLDYVELLAPVPNPGKMMNVGLNFYDHAEEMGMEIPDDFQPNFFWKGDRNCIIGSGRNIRLSSD